MMYEGGCNNQLTYDSDGSDDDMFSGRSCFPKPPTAEDLDLDQDDDSDDRLVIKSLDFNVLANAKSHHTDNFAMVKDAKPKLVVRRGQPFYVTIKFNRNFDENKHAVSFYFVKEGVPKPSRGQNSLIAIPMLLVSQNKPSEWETVCVGKDGYNVTVAVQPAANCLIGEWRVEVDSQIKNGEALRYVGKANIYILFNPWSKSDTVYLEGENLLKEYVLEENGIIWRGSNDSMEPIPWKYSQFDEGILEAALFIVQKWKKIPVPSLGDPIAVVRALSSMGSSEKGTGVLVGRWSQTYEGGTHPYHWLGSKKILQKFMATKVPVKYVQCWVFAGVLNTVARALGIPGRVVTNYKSGHDKQESLTIDYVVNESGKRISSLSDDSIWNFHVWNECWMKRPDLSNPKYNGWQIVDCTPQELSTDKDYACGPASVAAIKDGETSPPYDGKFIYSELNADILLWKYAGSDKPLKLLNKDVKGIGVNVSTKAVGKFTREDITNNYKYPEASREERDGLLKALKSSNAYFARYYLNTDIKDFELGLKVNGDIVIMGQPFTIRAFVKSSRTDKVHNITATLRLEALNYTGDVVSKIKDFEIKRQVGTGTTEIYATEMRYDDYRGKVPPQGSFLVSLFTSVGSVQHDSYTRLVVGIKTPSVRLSPLGPGAVPPQTRRTSELASGKFMDFSASFVNPLPHPITGVFKILGPGFVKELKIGPSKEVNPGEVVSVTFKAKVPESGTDTIVAYFFSEDLSDAHGYSIWDGKGWCDGNEDKSTSHKPLQ